MRRFLIPLVLVAVAACSKPALVSVPERPSHAILIKDVAVLDVDTGRRDEHRDVLVRAGRIGEIGETGSIKEPPGTEVIDGAHATLLPGLVDMHVHSGNPISVPWEHPLPHPERNARMFLYAGVTTVLDTGSRDDEAIERRDRIAAGELLGPRMFAVGPVVTTKGGHPKAMLATLPWWMRKPASHQVREVSDAGSVRQTILEVKGMRADFIKVVVDSIPDGIPHISDERLDEVGKAAKERDLRMVAHIGTTEDALDAGRAGASAWIHGVYRERIPDESIPALAKLGIPMVPTLVVFERYAALTERQPYITTRLERETIDADILAKLSDPPLDTPVAKKFGPYMEMLARERENAKDNIRRLHAAGVTLLAGSDTQAHVFPGSALHRELELLVEAGLTPTEAIRAATISPARFLTRKQDPDFGRIAVGAQADLLLVDGDPTADISRVSKIKAVIRAGRRLERKPLADTTSTVSRR